MKKSILLLFLLAVFIGADAKNYKVTADQLNVRSCASKNCKSVGSLQNGELVDVLEIVTSDNNEEWGKILLSSGEEGYVKMQYLIIDQVSGNGTEDKEDVNKVFGPSFYIGIGALVLFLIFFRISFRKKSFPIFVGKADFVLVIIAMIFLIGIDYDITSGTDSRDSVDILFSWFLFFIPYIISVILTLKKPLTSKQKLMSVLSKILFILSSVFLMGYILVVLCLFKKKKKKKIVVVDGVYREIEEDTKLWKKIKTYWKDMKNMSSQPTHIRMPIEDLNNDDDIDL